MKKHYVIQITFPHLKVKDAVQQVRVDAASISQAVRLALKDILRRPGIKGKRHRQLAIAVSQLEGTDKQSTEPETPES